MFWSGLLQKGSFFKGIYSLPVTGDRQKNLDFGQKVQSSENPNSSSKRKDNTCTIFWKCVKDSKALQQMILT